MFRLGGVFTALGIALHGYAFILIFRNTHRITGETQSKILWLIVFGVLLQIIGTRF